MRAKLRTPENIEWLKENFVTAKPVEIVSRFGYKYETVVSFANKLGLYKYKVKAGRATSENQKYINSMSYDPQTYLDPYITDNTVYDDNVYAYRNGYPLRNESLVSGGDSFIEPVKLKGVVLYE